MPLRPLLALLALSLAVAGCTPLPSIPDADSALRAPASTTPPITLRTQGLLKAELGASTVELSPTGAIVTTDVVIQDAKGEPLTGLKPENFVMSMTVTVEDGTHTAEELGMTLEITEKQAGTYRFVSTLEDANVTPSAFVIELAIRNAPLIRDVPYEIEDEEN